MTDDMARLRWQCRRGMLELDAILQPFFEKNFRSLSKQEQEEFERLLTCTDPELYSWFIGSEQPTDTQLNNIVTRIKQSFGS